MSAPTNQVEFEHGITPDTMLYHATAGYAETASYWVETIGAEATCDLIDCGTLRQQ